MQVTAVLCAQEVKALRSRTKVLSATAGTRKWNQQATSHRAQKTHTTQERTHCSVYSPATFAKLAKSTARFRRNAYMTHRAQHSARRLSPAKRAPLGVKVRLDAHKRPQLLPGHAQPPTDIFSHVWLYSEQKAAGQSRRCEHGLLLKSRKTAEGRAVRRGGQEEEECKRE